MSIDYIALIEKLFYRVENPSAWPEGFDQDASNLIGLSLTAIRTLLERNAELERELEMWREVKHSSHWKVRAEAAEAKLAEAMKVIEPFAEAAGAMDNLHGPDLSDTTRVRPGIYMGELRAARKFLMENENGE